ncbi:response regulator [Asticcacaulis sp. ZE23SCel15]|uniref:response regulator n=1 Tax=Asticcacaulis sp. ZE23SCel15 TaxID=3059027 RepID=UPI00265F4B05|nr:response regulator [Asticcacaulis sp. ZE23SCel15]WKL58659.1 response regulator [Asticcacaulis sp. ZE23SCel15]
MSHSSVLVLNPNRSEAQYIATLLDDQKWPAIVSFDPSTAFDLLKSERFKLLMFEANIDGANLIDRFDDIRRLAPSTPLLIVAHDQWGPKALEAQISGAKAAGAEFTLTKPFSKDQLKTILDETASYHRARRTEHHILVIEDDELLRTKVTLVLRQVGYTVSEAVNMEDAFFDHNLSLLDMVITSILIPGIGGIAGIGQIRKDWPHIKVIAMSQDANSKISALHVLAAAEVAGANAILPKPFAIPDFLKMVASVIKTGSAKA